MPACSIAWERMPQLLASSWLPRRLWVLLQVCCRTSADDDPAALQGCMLCELALAGSHAPGYSCKTSQHACSALWSQPSQPKLASQPVCAQAHANWLWCVGREGATTDDLQDKMLQAASALSSLAQTLSASASSSLGHGKPSHPDIVTAFDSEGAQPRLQSDLPAKGHV